MNKTLFRNPLFWAIFSILSVGAATLSIIYFPNALPILDLKISMSKSLSLEKAKEICSKYNLGPQEFQQTAYFDLENSVQNYIELELGGAKQFQKVIDEEIYCPYTWKVRHFKEGDAKECLIKLTPDGKPYAFIEQISENEPGPALSSEEAKVIAEQFIKTEWNLNLDNYKFIESSQEIRTNGRVDHSFVYERVNSSLGNNCKLVAQICGDKVTALNHYIDIPESFLKKFAELRTTNETISSFANTIIYVFYILFGFLFSFILLIRNNFLISKQAIILGTVLATAQTFAKLSNIPFIWFNYHTADSSSAYLAQEILTTIIYFFIYAGLYISTLIVAEGLSRKAFGNHLQFWQSFRPSVVSSWPMLGKIITSYLVLAFEFLFTTLFYSFGTQLFSWWNPSTNLVNPNILSTYAPGLSALSQALSAGFWEECLFRAVPLSLFALIGTKLKKRNLGIAIGFIVQAVVFGAAHASYPALPGYVRLIELIVPSFTFGTLYLIFGLIPGIIVHFVYDAILFSIPIFVSKAPEMFTEKLIVILGILSPVIFLCISRLLNRKWGEIDKKYYNCEWKSNSTDIQVSQQNTDNLSYTFKVTKPKTIVTVVLGLIGLISLSLLATKTQFLSNNSNFTINIDKSSAVSQAKKYLNSLNINIDHNWKIIPDIPGVPSNNFNYNNKEANKFIWTQEDKSIYNKLINNYISTPQWIIRFALFNNKDNKKYQVSLDADGKVERFQCIMPEDMIGKSLSEEKARILAKQEILNKFKLKEKDLKEIKYNQTKRPLRMDWEFIFKDTTINLKSGQANILVIISGDMVTDISKYIQIPETWIRSEKTKEQLSQIINISKILAFILMLIIAITQAYYLVKSSKFNFSYSILMSLIFFFFSCLQIVLNIDKASFCFSTTKPFLVQLWSTLLLNFMGIIGSSLIIFILSGIILNKKYQEKISGYNKLLFGTLFGINIVGLIALSSFLFESSPIVPLYMGLKSDFPLVVNISYYITTYISITVYMLFLAKFATNSIAKFITSIALISVIFTPHYLSLNINEWFLMCFISCVILTLMYLLTIKHNFTIIPTITATTTISKIIYQIILQAYPNSTAIGLSSIIAVTICSFLITAFMKQNLLEKVYFVINKYIKRTSLEI